MRVATCGLGTRRCARVASAGAMKISGLTVIVTCVRVINLSPNAGRFALVEPIVGRVPCVTHPAVGADAPSPARAPHAHRVLWGRFLKPGRSTRHESRSGNVIRTDIFAAGDTDHCHARMPRP